MSINSRKRRRMLDGLILLTLLTVACAAPDEQGETEAGSTAGQTESAPSDIPRFRVDPFWASELPNGSVWPGLGSLSALTIMSVLILPTT